FFENIISSIGNDCTKFDIPDVKVINYLWDAIELNDKEIINDFSYFNSGVKKDDKFENVSFINKKDIYLGNDCKLAPNVVIDASDGPVIIDNNVKIMPNSSIFGPCYIGKNSIIRTGAKIYGKTTIGEVCKIGGEVENSIVHAYSNKQHDGYLGHSYISEWVNIGADTNTSDLKNTYGEIKVNLEGREINTHRIFLGLLCGDHSKAGINTMFTTGTVAGIAGILVNEWFLPNTISSFSWGGGKNSSVYKASKAIDIAKIVMARRNKTLLPEEEILIQREHDKIIQMHK
ncbi:MAG: glucose-1-phosphate thymidylyltransferase, partial [FCB group bacterium]